MAACPGRVILHIDLDCFYCQVEQKRLGIPREIPCAVQQWEGLIAINYAARALGISRHMRAKEALQKCPELRCIHVQTVGGETGTERQEGAVNGGVIHPSNRSMQKACLERYRRASTEIILVLRSVVPQAKIEKASVDEVYIDITSLVEKELSEREEAAAGEHAVVDAFAWGSIVEGGALDTESEYDRRLSAGAAIACRLRGAVREKLGFTCSAGIAQNKLLAKIGSARNKPNQQTIVTARGIPDLMQNLPLKKLRNFGGKLGAELQAMGASTAGEASKLPLKQLQQKYGAERAKWIFDCVNGTYDEPVTERDLPKSMLAAKSFEATSDMATLTRWLGVLADELSERLIIDAQLNQRYPRLLVLTYRPKDCPAGRSKSIPMPRGPTAETLKDAALGVLQKCPDSLPCCNLGLTATDFQDNPSDDQRSITRFLQPRASSDSSPSKGRTKGQESNPAPKLQRPAPKTIDNLFRRAATKRSQSQLMAPGGSGRQKLADEANSARGKQPDPAVEARLAEGNALCASEPKGDRAVRSSGLDESSQPPEHTATAAATISNGCPGSGEGIEDVDLAEQKRIMHEIWVRRNLSRPDKRAKASHKSPAQGQPPAKSSQHRLTDMFAAKQR